MQRDKQLVMPILQSGAIKPWQKKKEERDDVIKIDQARPQTTERCVENEIWHLLVSCITLRSPHHTTHTQICSYSSPQ